MMETTSHLNGPHSSEDGPIYPMGEDGLSIPHTQDARTWAKFWLDTIKDHPGVPTDEGTMISWFANALMAGYDRGFQAGLRLKQEESRP